ncbi:hypothetical protein BUALT_Bualt10G0092000 [Buddleja alternifolia]|uniref:Ubiquitin carboxyl-terminal hydrolase 36/42 n=1 Tax=Buddleja alternifolia TaxID=168488 RepID=A0AAV6X891_9LAMI|nr:hypothetical protein BUALT_Bualt10G0092000 [Buddleja alternifolia]
MHVAADLNWFLQFVVVAFAGAFGLLYLVRNTASRYFVVDSNFDSSAADYSSLDRQKSEMGGGDDVVLDSCAVCGLSTKKKCAACKMVKYCSEACQISHWSSEHKTKCKDLQSLYKANHVKSTSLRARKASLVPGGGSSKLLKQSNKILFPYEEFIELFNWNKPDYPPCGLINCGNSCFANVVLQCLAYTRPLIAYLLEKGHRIECQRDDWCFLCEFQTHVERASCSHHPFSPINILSRLPNIGGNLGYGKQEDAHEFMRFAIDTMQSVCLDEFGGEKAVHPTYQETTLIQHIFGGRLQSQVICAECTNVSNQFENMMDLTVEIHGDARSLEECLDQFTAKERLHGDNMYKCDGCNAYVMAWKRLTVQRAPNILTIALKRFQSGRFGKLNKRVTFPETLDLSPYMSELEDGNDVYKLYALIVHVDMLNASYFGHYICYVKDVGGNWYRIDDCKVAEVDLDEVLSQGAYMLLYSRVCARPSCLLPANLLKKEDSENVEIKEPAVWRDIPVDSWQASSANCAEFKVNCEEELSSSTYAEGATKEDLKRVSAELSSPIMKIVELQDSEGSSIAPKEVVSPVKHTNQPNPINISLIDKTSTQSDDHYFEPSSPVSDRSKINGNCTSEEGNKTCDVSEIAISNDEVQDELESANSTSIHENRGFENGSPSFLDIRDAIKKSNGEISSTKPKPLFAPGFLGKKSRSKCIKPEVQVSTEVVESNLLTPNSHPRNQTNEIAIHLPRENGGFLKGEEQSYIMHKNGKAHMK